MFFPYYFDRTILLVLVGMAIVGWAQWRVSHVYKKNQALYTQKGEMARRLPGAFWITLAFTTFPSK